MEKQHGIDQGAGLFILHQSIQHPAQNAGPHIEDVDAPGAEAYGEDQCQGGHIVGGGLQQHIKPGAGQTHQTHIQEGGGVTAHSEVVGGHLTGIAEDLPQAGEHIAPVGHKKCRNQKTKGEKAVKQLQKVTFGQIFDLFHGTPHGYFWIKPIVGRRHASAGRLTP